MPSISENALASNPSKTRWTGFRILLVSYAFPPLQVPMSQVAAKIVAGLTKQGCRVDVIAGGSFDTRFGFDPSLLPYVRRNSASVRYLLPSRWKKISARIQNHLNGEVDAMHLLEEDTSEAIESLLGNNYAALLTLSPFHSINPVLVRLKMRHPDLRWIAQFSDPWSKNPLATSQRREAWNLQHEAETIRLADHLVFTSAPARDLMLADMNCSVNKTTVVDHSWDPDLYPLKRPHPNRRFIIRHIGSMFGGRTPEHLFEAALILLQKRPELAERFVFHFVGWMPENMVRTKAALALPSGMILRDEPVSYLKSLYLMASADALVLIEPDITFNYFVPSKVIDYVGADRPILALTPPGASRQVIKRLQLSFCTPGNIPEIAAALSKLLDQASSPASFKASPASRVSVRNDVVAQTYLELVG